MRNTIYLVFFFSILSFSSYSQADYFYPGAGPFNPSIPTPEQFLGYPVGGQHSRHDRIISYFQELDRLSDRVSLEILGYTFEKRAQIGVVFTSPGNQQQLEKIRQAHLAGQTAQTPLVIHLGYNVHGNEPSSSEAALLTAYYLTASESPETANWLQNMVILMDPVINPDGRDRHTHWANMHKAEPPVADPLDREHNEIWPGGRFNHYWFDLNRDWFLGTFPETRNRIRFFHHWRPYVQTDHHEMGTSSTLYFDPGEDASNNPVVPDFLYKTIYPRFATYFSAAANKIGSMYFTKEAFDKLYPGYGSSYINFYGGAGFLFEQASSRGHVQETPTIPLTFAFTIRNQFTASLAIIRASLAEKDNLVKLRSEFYRSAREQAAKAAIKGYVFGEPQDATRTRAFLDLLLLHKIEVYELGATVNAEGRKFETGKAYYVPCEQENYIMVRSVFEKQITYQDSSFYDASAWSLVNAFNLPYAESRLPLTKGKQVSVVPAAEKPAVAASQYAYVASSTDYNIHKAIYQLQEAGVIVQTSFRPFSLTIDGKRQDFGYGSLVIPVGLQRLGKAELYDAVKTAAEQSGVPFQSVGTGYSVEGVDLGSNYVRALKQPKVAMIIGTGVAAPEAGEIWHLLDQRLQMPVTKIDLLTLNRASLDRYNTLIMVSGNYSLIDKTTTDRIKAWVQNGGTFITIKSGSEWAIRNGFTRERLLPADSSREAAGRKDFDRAVAIEGAKEMGGSLFRADLDTTHPIGFGYTARTIPVYRNGLTFLLPSSNPYSTVLQYKADPLIGGYVHPSVLKKISRSASILTGQEGSGRVILFADNPNFRGVWYGTNKLFLNALFYGGLITVPAVRGEEQH